MSVLGPVSTLSPVTPDAYVDLDFRDGYVPEDLVYTRSSNHGVWSRDGVYSVVPPNTPPLTWVPELGSYALALEPAKLNLLTTSTSTPVGMGPFTMYTQPPEPLKAGGIVAEGIDGPDGKNDAIRVIGAATTNTQTSLCDLGPGLIISYTLYVRQAGTLSRFRVRPRVHNIAGNNGASLTSNEVQIDLQAGTIHGTPSVGILYKTRKVSRGYWEIVVTIDGTKTETPLTEGSKVGLYLGYIGSMTATVPDKPYFDVWFGQAEHGYPTSLIIPGNTSNARTAGNATALIKDAGVTGFSTHLDMGVIWDGVSSQQWAKVEATSAIGDRFNTIIMSYGMRYQSINNNGVAFGATIIATPFRIGEMERVRVAANIIDGRADAIANNGSQYNNSGNSPGGNPVKSVIARSVGVTSVYLSAFKVFKSAIDLSTITKI